MKKAFLIVALAALTLSACGNSKDKDNRDRSDVAYKAEGTKPGSQPYVVDFSATWCGPCQQLKPYFEQMEKDFEGKAQFRTVDVDENEELANAHGIDGVPTVIIFSDSSMTHELTRIVGFDPEGIEEAIKKHI